MRESVGNRFAPDYAVHPGEVLAETLAARGVSKSDLAERCGLSAKTVSLIVNGKAPVTSETAIQLERALGVAAEVWVNLDANYRLHVAKQGERERLEAAQAWAARLPVKELAERGYLGEQEDPLDRLRSLLGFFGVASVGAWEARTSRLVIAYRKSPAFEISKAAVVSWLRIGEIEAEQIETDPFVRKGFRDALEKIRTLTTAETAVIEPEMKRLCKRAGVALVVVPELPKTRLCGATRWLSPDKALLLLSRRHGTDDQFWFTFYHEAGHVLLHGKKDVFIDEEGVPANEEEDEANRFAASFLIPNPKYVEFLRRGRFYKEDIVEFAATLGIAPGIVVGRLQHDGKIPFQWHNGLKKAVALDLESGVAVEVREPH